MKSFAYAGIVAVAFLAAAAALSATKVVAAFCPVSSSTRQQPRCMAFLPSFSPRSTKTHALFASTESSAAAQQATADPFEAYEVGKQGQDVATRDLVVGSGDVAAKEGDTLTVNYKGKVMSTGIEFASGKHSFTLGNREVIRAFDNNLPGIRVGGKRVLRIPPEQGYGVKGIPGTVPSNADLEFEVTVEKITSNPSEAFVAKQDLGLNPRTLGMAFFLGLMAILPMFDLK